MRVVKKRLTVLCSLACCFCLLGGPALPPAAAEEAAGSAGSGDAAGGRGEQETAGTYYAYQNAYGQEPRPETAIERQAAARTDGTAAVRELEGRECVALEAAGAWAEWSIETPETGLYALYPAYYPLTGTGKDMQIAVSIDGTLPFTEAADLSLPRIWADELAPDQPYRQDYAGNDIRPAQVETPRWNETGLRDLLGMYEEPYLFYLESGTHTIRFSYAREPVAISGFSFRNERTAIPYKEYISQYKESDYAAGGTIRQEAERASEKNSETLYPIYDRGDAATLPNDPYNTKLNTIGGSNWNTPGNAISWIVDVPEPGLYRLAFRARQNYSEGLNAYRRLYINGEIPFQEAENVVFPYKQNWYLKTLGEEQPLLLYLKAGDVITLECTSGAMSMPLREVQQAVLDLNALYRDIIMITGTSPSIYQDYSLDTQLPDLPDSLKDICKRLHMAQDAISEELGKTSSAAASIAKSVRVFEELADDPFFIPDRLSNFKGSIESMASLLLTLGGQPVELDSLFYIPPAAPDPAVRPGFFRSFAYGFQRFAASFFNDYNTIGSASLSDEKAILVWAGVGRDQAQIMNRLIEEHFTQQTGIPVVLNLVTGDATLIKATLAGKGPDVSLTVGATTPVNLAARGALVDLSQFDLSELKAQTYPSAWTPFEYNGGLYALPESQNTELFFYRKDVFQSLNLTPPETWDDFYRMLEELQSKNLQFGWPEINSANQGSSLAIPIFGRFLFQNGGEYYNEAHSQTQFDTEAAYAAFEQTVELYKTYGISRDMSFFNRFRSGDAPAGVSSYILYTQLMASAPEIRGLWSFTLMPGTRGKDGTVNRTQEAAATGCVMMASAKSKGVEKQAFAFMSWWAGAQAQTLYGKELESVLGIIGRITPANREALSQLGWTEEELDIITRQLEWSKNVPQVLGNYTVDRSLTSALRAAISDKNTPRRALTIYNKNINDEITRKRKEFKLD